MRFMSPFTSDEQRKAVMAKLNQRSGSTSGIQVNWEQPTQGQLNNFSGSPGKIVYMRPEEYIQRVNIRNRKSDFEIEHYKERALKSGARGILYYPVFSEGNKERLEQAMLQGNEMEMPWLLYDDYQLKEQEGFHRAMACRDLGIKEIPVVVYGDIPSRWKVAPHSIDEEIYGV